MFWPLIILSVLLLMVDLYVFKGLNMVTSTWSKSAISIIRASYWALSVFMVGSLLFNFMNYGTIRDVHPQWWIFSTGLFFVLFIPKMIFAIFHLLDDLWNLGRWGISKIPSVEFDQSRRLFITKIGLAVSALSLTGVAYGVTKGKFAFRVLSEKINSPRLPKSFDGLRVVQISDAHLGSFVRNYGPIERMVTMINDLEPDFIFFTGDMVNEHAQEAEGWEDVFAALKAKEGKYSIFGNHDYAMYGPYDEAQKQDSMNRLRAVHKKMGFRLLEDEHLNLNRNGETINIVGVHNWGPGFGEYGDIDKAMDGTQDDRFKILLSHDPTHYEKKIMGKQAIDLTLSGHTHGMQMGIEIPSLGIKVSPVSLRYKRWGGLYQDKGQYLYVNRGMGVLGLPGRIGMPPEITCLDLFSV